MKILFVNEYFYPFTPGGTEWSSFYLAKDLVQKGNKVIVLTPNYGAVKQESKDGFKIVRFSFPKKLKKGQLILTPFWLANIFFYFYSAFWILRVAKKEKVDIIHVQGKYLLPGGVIAKKILKIPVVATFRDYIPLCNYGFCLYDKDKVCNLKEYFLEDFRFYYQNYIQEKNLMNFFLNLIFAIRGQIQTRILNFFAKKVDQGVCLSKKHKEIYKNSGFKNLQIIYNSSEFNKLKPRAPENILLFVGRITIAKGAKLLLQAIPEVLKKYPELKFYFIGSGMIKTKVKNTHFLGHISHKKLKEFYQKAKLVVVPSIWPEPFGRVALEALSFGAPVVATNRGGLPEIVEEGVTGFIVEPKPNLVAKAIIRAIKNNQGLRKNIKSRFTKLKHKFGESVTNKYIKIYQAALFK